MFKGEQSVNVPEAFGIGIATLGVAYLVYRSQPGNLFVASATTKATKTTPATSSVTVTTSEAEVFQQSQAIALAKRYATQYNEPYAVYYNGSEYFVVAQGGTTGSNYGSVIYTS